MFSYFLHDAYENSFRKVLNMERYHNQRLTGLLQKQYFDDAIVYQIVISQHLMKAGILKSFDPQITALQFYSPVFLLLQLCDSNSQYRRTAIELPQQHIRQFPELDSTRGN